MKLEMIQYALLADKSNQSELRSLRNEVGYDGQPKRRECTKCGRFPNSISASLTFALWRWGGESSSGIFDAFFRASLTFEDCGNTTFPAHNERLILNKLAGGNATRSKNARQSAKSF